MVEIYPYVKLDSGRSKFSTADISSKNNTTLWRRHRRLEKPCTCCQAATPRGLHLQHFPPSNHQERSYHLRLARRARSAVRTPDCACSISRLTAGMLSKIAKRISPKEYQATPLCNGVSLCAGEERKGRCLGLGFGLGETGVAEWS